MTSVNLARGLPNEHYTSKDMFAEEKRAVFFKNWAGIGFGKDLAQNLALINRLGELRSLGYPLLFGPSRKGFIGKTLGGLPPEERLEGTIVTCVLAIDRGVDMLRVHDVKAVARAASMADAVVRS